MSPHGTRPRVARRRRVVTAVLTAAAVTVPVGASAVLGSGDPAMDLPLSGGSAWLASSGEGLLTLVDGPSERVVGAVATIEAATSDEVSIHQQGMSALVVNSTQGTLSRVDASTWTQQPPTRVADEGSGIAVRRNEQATDGDEPGAVFVVDQSARVAHVVDPQTLTAGPPLSLGAPATEDRSVVDERDRLWVVEPGTGSLTGFDASTSPATKRIAPLEVTETAQLVHVQGEPVVVDPAAAQLGVVSGDGRVEQWSCLDVPADDEGVQYVGSRTTDEVYAVVPSTGTLLTTGTSGDDCTQVLRLADAGQELGPVVQSDRFLFVPNRSTGRAVVVDLDRGAVAGDVDVVDPGASLELVVSGGIVFYNDRDSDLAGVLQLDGSGRWVAGDPLRKYGSGVDELAEVPRGDVEAAAADLPSDDAAEGGDVAEPIDAPEDDPGQGSPGEPADPADPARPSEPAGPGSPPSGSPGGATPPRAPGSPSLGDPAPGGTPPSQGPVDPSPGDPGGDPTGDPSDDPTGDPSDDPTGDPGDDPTDPVPPPPAPPSITGLAASPTTAAPGEPVTVTATTTGTAGARWAWDAGPAGTGSSPDAFTFTMPSGATGSIDVTLTVTTDAGSDTASVPVTVASAGSLSVSCAPNPPGIGQTVTCTGDLQGATSPPPQWTWTVQWVSDSSGSVFDTIVTPAGAPLSWALLQPIQDPGTYTITLTVGSGAMQVTDTTQFTVTMTCRFTTDTALIEFDEGDSEISSSDVTIGFEGCLPSSGPPITFTSEQGPSLSVGRPSISFTSPYGGTVTVGATIDVTAFTPNRPFPAMTGRIAGSGSTVSVVGQALPGPGPAAR